MEEQLNRAKAYERKMRIYQENCLMERMSKINKASSRFQGNALKQAIMDGTIYEKLSKKEIRQYVLTLTENQRNMEMLHFMDETTYLEHDVLEQSKEETLAYQISNRYQFIDQILIADGVYYLSSGGREYRYQQASSYLQSDTCSHYIDTLHDTQYRAHNCMEYTEVLSQQIKGNAVCGYLKGFLDDERILHAWVEKDDMIFDFANNLAMFKDEYHSLFVKEEILVIPHQELQNHDMVSFANAYQMPYLWYLLETEQLKTSKAR